MHELPGAIDLKQIGCAHTVDSQIHNFTPIDGKTSNERITLRL